MAFVYVLDLMHLEGVDSLSCTLRPPRAWFTAAELCHMSAPQQAMEAWTAVSSDLRTGSSSSSAAYILREFPQSAMACNKYFRTRVKPVVGFYQRFVCTDGKATSAQMRRDATTNAIQEFLRSVTMVDASSSCVGNHEFGCVLIVSSRQDPSEVPWHLFTVHQPHFCAALVYNTGDGAYTEHLQEWKQRCMENRYECIEHHTSATGSLYANEAPEEMCWPPFEALEANIGSSGLCRGELTGGSRVLQILCNTLWPHSVREASMGKDTVCDREAQATPSITPTPIQNRCLLVGDDPGCMLDSLKLASFVPDDCTGRCTEAHRPYDARFSTYVLDTSSQMSSWANASPVTEDHATAAALETEAYSTRKVGRSAELLSAENDVFSPNAHLLLVNKWYAAQVQPIFLHTSLAQDDMTDVLRRRFQYERSTPGLQPFALVFWPPSASTGTGIPVSLEVLLNALRANAVLDIVVITRCRTALSFHGEKKAQRRKCNSKNPSDTLDVYERQLCHERGIEVISLFPVDHADRSAWLLYEKDTQDDNVRNLPTSYSANRLREVMHCVEWGTREPIPPIHSPPLARPLNNSCLLCAFGSSAIEEEKLMAHILHHGLHFASSNERIGTMHSNLHITVPSLFLAPPQNTFPVHNKYFHTDVEVYTCGGIRSLFHKSNLAPEMLKAYQAIVLVTTLDQLRAEVPRVTTRIDDCTYRDDNAPPLFTALRCLQDYLEWHRKQVEGTCGDDGDTEDRTAEEFTYFSSAKNRTDLLSHESPVVLLYLIDADGSQEDIVLEVETLLMNLLFPASHVDSCMKEDNGYPFPLMEIVFADSTEGAVRDRETTMDGCPRIREAIEQFPWTCVTAENTEKEPHHVDVCKASETSTAAATSVAIGCELPPTVLIDPLTLRSQRVPALVCLQSKRQENAMEDKQELSTLREEVMVWIKKMKSHGNRLSWKDRERQASLLSVALEDLLC